MMMTAEKFNSYSKADLDKNLLRTLSKIRREGQNHRRACGNRE